MRARPSGSQTQVRSLSRARVALIGIGLLPGCSNGPTGLSAEGSSPRSSAAETIGLLTLENADPMPNESGPTELSFGNIGGAQTTNGSYQLLSQVAPDDPTALSFVETLNSKIFSGDPTRPNWVWSQGWNYAASGDRLDTTDAALATQYESYWAQDATKRWLEYHLIGMSYGGVEYRPLSFQFARDGSYVTGFISADSFNIMDRNAFNGGSTYFIFGTTPEPNGIGFLYIEPNASIRASNNGAPFLVQENAQNNQFLSLAYLDRNNNVDIGVGGTLGGNANGVILGSSSSTTTVSGNLTVSGNAVTLGGSSSSTTISGGLSVNGNSGFGSAVIASAGVAPTSTSAAPACNASTRGTIYVLQGAPGAADTVEACLSSAAGTYSWVPIVTGG